MVWVLAALAVGCDNGDDFDGDGYVEPEDCDDNDPNSYPGAEEVAYDGRDQDCDGSDLVDRDGDGFQAEEAGGPDCNDFDPKVHPGARDVPYNGTDGDCDNWSDDDFDHDGFDAMGHGGDDCDDRDARITPLDLDGDGYSPCTGDCDEGDARRNADAEPICGNGFDDDCDDVSDCTQIGVLSVDDLAVRITADPLTIVGFGTSVAAPGDLGGGPMPDLVVSGGLVSGGGRVWLYEPPFAAPTDADAGAWAAIDVPRAAVVLGSPGDVDGDGVADLSIADLGGGIDVGHLWIVTGVRPGAAAVADLATLDLVGTVDADVGRAMVRIGDQLAIGASGLDQVQILSASTTGVRGFGEDGAVLVGSPNQGAGAALDAVDSDGDGEDELIVSASGGSFVYPSALFRLTSWPSSGSAELDELAVGTVDTRDWGQSTTTLAHGDLDGDGRLDVVAAAPFAEQEVGAVAVLLEPLTEDLFVEDVAVQRLGLGDDTFGWAVLADDFDGDGQDDLMVGSPAAWGAVGGADKPGNVFVWYGPIAETVEHMFTADLLVEGAYTGHRTFAGYRLARIDGDGDGGVDVAIGSPNEGSGVVALLPGGLSGLYGL